MRVSENQMWLSLIGVGLAFAAGPGAGAAEKATSEWVHPGPDGKLVYKTTPAGDRIMDFSHAGYMGGGVALPEVPVKITVKPVEGDNTAAIQEAIDKVSAMSPEKGFRGAVLLAPGDYTCSATISIRTSGVVLRGSGSGASGSTIKMVGGRHVAIVDRCCERPAHGRSHGAETPSSPDLYRRCLRAFRGDKLQPWPTPQGSPWATRSRSAGRSRRLGSISCRWTI